VVVSNGLLTRIGLNVRSIRKSRGFTQEGFARLAALDRAYYGRIERGQQNISLVTLGRVAFLLNVEPAALLADVTLSDCQSDKVDR